jgi:hypothetical protein
VYTYTHTLGRSFQSLFRAPFYAFRLAIAEIANVHYSCFRMYLDSAESQASMHQPQPSHFSSSTEMTPVSCDCSSPSRGHAATQGASSHSLHATAKFMKGFKSQLGFEISLDYMFFRAPLNTHIRNNSSKRI